MKQLFIIFNVFFLLNSACTKTIKIENDKEGKLISSVHIALTNEKAFNIDNQTAPKTQYTQLYTALSGKRYFTFLNTHNNSIYFYDYSSTNFIKKIQYATRGDNGVNGINAYFIDSFDSIYVFNEILSSLILTNSDANIISKSVLRNPNIWNGKFYYPPFIPRTAQPFLKEENNILLTGMLTGEVPDSIYDKLKFTCVFGLNSKTVKYIFSYPKNIYKGYTWGDLLFREVFYDLAASKKEIVFSFPCTHNVYIGNLQTGEMKPIYAGSNFAGTIKSINRKPQLVTNEKTVQHFLEQDAYAAIKYDPFRKVYYRFLRHKITNPEIGKHSILDKEISVIIYDEAFNYLGETKIGTGKHFFWLNSFVTKEGLNIQYTDGVEEAIRFKIYKIIENE